MKWEKYFLTTHVEREVLSFYVIRLRKSPLPPHDIRIDPALRFIHKGADDEASGTFIIIMEGISWKGQQATATKKRGKK